MSGSTLVGDLETREVACQGLRFGLMGPAEGRQGEAHVGRDVRPRVQVLMATRNGARFLRPQLQSIASQRGVIVTLRVLDDGSSDETLNLLQEFSQSLDLEVVPLRQPVGLPGSFLALLNSASSDVPLVALADQDDIWHEAKLISAYEALRRSGATLWMCDYLAIDGDGKPLSYRPARLDPRRLGFGNALIQTPRPGCSMVFTGDLLPHLQDVDPKRIVMHDSWLYLCASAFGSVISDPRRLVSYRIHESNAVGLASSPVQRSRRLLERAIRRSSPRAVQARYHHDRGGHALSDRQRQTAEALCEPGLRGVRMRTGLWRREELRAALASQDALLLASLLVPLRAD